MRKQIDIPTRRRLIQEWHASGESARTYAIRQGIPLSTFYEWSRRFSANEEPAFTELVVVADKPAAQGSTDGVELTIGGVIVHVAHQTDLDLLARVLKVLRAC